ncbi:MAG: glycosyltransferase family 2 protein [Bacillota bacterium]
MNQRKLLSIIISWNRPKLLEKTVHSYFQTIKTPHQLIIVDNASNQETKSTILKLEEQYNLKTSYLNKNMGGIAFNKALSSVNLDEFDFIHFSENDIEYLPGWDKKLLSKFNHFPKLGQISPYSPFPQFEKGEIWSTKKGNLLTNKGHSIYVTTSIGTTCIVRKEIIQSGVRWENIQKGNWSFPKDRKFSVDIKKIGWQVAWNDCYVATNWGHNIKELQKNINYYVNNYRRKGWCSLKGLRNRLRKNGYDLVKNQQGQYRIISKKK